MAVACVPEQKNVRPVKYLEIQLNYITAISLARERSVLQLGVLGYSGHILQCWVESIQVFC